LRTGNIRPGEIDDFDKMKMTIGDETVDMVQYKKLKKSEINPQNTIIFENEKGKIYGVPVEHVNTKIAKNAILN